MKNLFDYLEKDNQKKVLDIIFGNLENDINIIKKHIISGEDVNFSTIEEYKIVFRAKMAKYLIIFKDLKEIINLINSKKYINDSIAHNKYLNIYKEILMVKKNVLKEKERFNEYLIDEVDNYDFLKDDYEKLLRLENISIDKSLSYDENSKIVFDALKEVCSISVDLDFIIGKNKKINV